jgi:hypothetical protein
VTTRLGGSVRHDATYIENFYVRARDSTPGQIAPDPQQRKVNVGFIRGGVIGLRRGDSPSTVCAVTGKSGTNGVAVFDFGQMIVIGK